MEWYLNLRSYFGLNSFIGYEYLSLIFSLKADTALKRATWCSKRGSGVKTMENVNRPQNSVRNYGVVQKLKRFFHL